MTDENESASEIVVERSFRRVIFIAIFGLIALAALMLMSSEPAEAYTVFGTETWPADTYLNENLIIASGGVLNVQSATVYMQPTFDGEFVVDVQPGGTLNLVDSGITRDPGFPFYYDFIIEPGSTASFLNSRVSFSGSMAFVPGMFVLTQDITMNGLTITDNFIGMIYANDVAGFTMNNCNINSNLMAGILVMDAGAADYFFNFQGGTFIENNGQYGIYVDPLSNTNLGLTLQDTVIRGHDYGIWIEEVNNGFAFLDFSSSTISDNLEANVWVDDMINGDLGIFAFDGRFTTSPNGYGIYVGNMGGPLGSNLTMMLDTCFVILNGKTGIHVENIFNGWMTFDFFDTYVETNGITTGGHGVRTPLVAPDSFIIFNAWGSSFSGNVWSGVYISPARPGSIFVTIDDCDLVFNGDYGLEVGRVGDGDKSLDITNSWLEGNMGWGGAILDNGAINATVSYFIDNNEFNNSYAGIYIQDSLEAISGYGHTLSFTFNNNWLDSNVGQYGVHFASYIRNFDDTTLTIVDNYFWGQESRDYGVYFDSFIRGDLNYQHTLTLSVTGNEFVGLDEAGVYATSLYWFSSVDIDLNGNYFQDTDLNFEYGFRLLNIYTDASYDSYLDITAVGNEFWAIGDRAFFFNIFNIRHVNIDLSWNLFVGNDDMAYGIYFNNLYYGTSANYSDLVLSIDNNVFIDFGWAGYGIYINTGSQIFFTSVDMTFSNNHFNATSNGNMFYGVYFNGDIRYTTADMGYFGLTFDHNEFLSMYYDGVRIPGTIYDYADVYLQYINNLFENINNNIWMDYGVFHQNPVRYNDDSDPSSLIVMVSDNQFYDLSNDGIRFNNAVYGFRNVTLAIERNIFENRVSNYMDYAFYCSNGIYYGSNNYDNFFHISIRDNTVRDMSSNGIYFSSGSPTYGFRNVDVQIHDNVFENIISPSYMDYGVFWYYEIYYNTNMYDNSFVFDATGNYFADLSNDGIAFRYSAGYDFGYFANVIFNIQDNTLLNTVGSNMDYGLFLRTTYVATETYDNSIDITILNNTFDSLSYHAIYFYSGSGYDFEGYRNANVLISQNRFINTMGNWMDSAVYLQGFEYWNSSFANSLNIEISGNTVSDMTQYGIYFEGQINYYSQVDINTHDNYFSDIYNNFDIGIYFPSSIFYTTDNDGYFHLTSIRNTFSDLMSYGINFGNNVYDFRDATIEIQDSFFQNTISNWMDYGVNMHSVYYSDDSWDNYFILDITNNRFENLSYCGFMISSIYTFRNIDIDIVDNFFGDEIDSSFDYGVHFSNVIYYSSAYAGSFILSVTGNTFQDLVTRGLHFSNDVVDFSDVTITIDDNDFVCYMSNWMDDGVYFNGIFYDNFDITSSFRLDITNNNFENLTYAGFRINNQVYYRYVLINVINNWFSDVYGSFDYGVYVSGDIFYTTLHDSDLTINVMDNTAHDLSNYAIRFGQFYDFRNVTIVVDNNDFRNTISNWMDYGMYISEVEHDGYLDFTNFYMSITNNNFENLSWGGFVIYDIYDYRYTTIDVVDNYFSDIYYTTDYGLYLGDDIGMDDPDNDAELRINILDNEFRNLYWWGCGVYMEDLYNFRHTWITVDNNDFFNVPDYSRTGYGVYLDYVYYDSDDFDTYLWIEFTNNDFENMYQEGITIYEVYGYRHVYMDFLDNTFTDVHNAFDYGIYLGEDSIYYTTEYDSEFYLTIAGNTFMDLSGRGVYSDSDIYDFRNMWITIENNDFLNTISNWMDYGMYFYDFYYDMDFHDSYLYFDVNNNTFENLNNRGIYVSGIYGIRNVDMDIHYNDFSDIYDSFNYGIYVSNEISYTTSYPGVLDLFVTNNNFNDLTSYAVYFDEIYEYQDTDIVVQDNDFSRSNYGFYISGGVDYAYDWYFLFTRNNGDDMGGYMLHLGGTSYGEWGFSSAQIVVTENTMSNSWDGFYVGSIYYYDLSGMILIEDNDLLDMYNGFGIDLGWFSEDQNAHFLIQDNMITGNMWAAIYLSGCEDMAFVLDIINNDIYGAQNAIYLDEPVYGDDVFTVGTINIVDNDVLDLTGYGLYIYEVYYGLMDLTVDNNEFRGDPVAYYGVTFFYFEYADWNSISNIKFTNDNFVDGFYGFYFYESWRAMITFEMDDTSVTNTYYTFYFEYPVDASSDVLNVKIRKSTFDGSRLSFFHMSDPGYGLFVVEITDCHVLNYGSLGGYGFYLGDNDGAYIRIDVYSTEFVGSSSRLGDAFAGDGQILINFWYIDGIESGVTNGWNQRIQVLWDVDVQVWIGSNYTTTAGPGIIVYVDDQFGYQSFYTTTDANGRVLGKTVAGTLITYTGQPFSGSAVHTFYAVQGPFSGSAVGVFDANGTVSILLPGDNDGDGLHDGIDIDDDNDGVVDQYDVFPYDPSESKDTDWDGIGDNVDTDDDGDGVQDAFDAFPDNPSEWSDLDGDGVGDNTDIDIDGDGIPNISDTSPYNNTGFQDSDGDGVADAQDEFPYTPSEWLDTDGDGIGNNADGDDDGDGVPDDVDLYPFDSSLTDTRADEQVNIDINEAADWTSPLIIIIIGVILMLLMWILFGRRREETEEGFIPIDEEEYFEEAEETPAEEMVFGGPEETEEGPSETDESLDSSEDVF